MSLRFQVARYLLLVAWEVASGHGGSPPSSRGELSLAVYDDHVFIKEKYNILRHSNNKFSLYVKAGWRGFFNGRQMVIHVSSEAEKTNR